jgi:hypothetical protein
MIEDFEVYEQDHKDRIKYRILSDFMTANKEHLPGESNKTVMCSTVSQSITAIFITEETPWMGLYQLTIEMHL